jgi:hypothetical protein
MYYSSFKFIVHLNFNHKYCNINFSNLQQIVDVEFGMLQLRNLIRSKS